MKFGLVLPIQSQHESLEKLIDQIVAEAVAAEEAGFEACFLPEFHQAHGGAVVSPHIIGSAILRSTQRLRFGAAVLATPLHHPVRLAEEILMLDWMSKGRIILGLGIGHQVPDFQAFGVNRELRGELTEEILEVLLKCFSGEAFQHDGDHFKIAAHITPLPYQQPRPPIWMGAHSRRGLQRAAQWSDLWLSDPQRDTATCGRLATYYREEAARLQRPAVVGLFREAWIGDDKRDCESNWGQHALAIHRLYYNVGVYRKVFEPWVDEVRNRADFTFDRLAPGRFLYGNQTDIRDTITEWKAQTGCEFMALRMRHPGGPGHAATLEAIKRFGSEIIAAPTGTTS